MSCNIYLGLMSGTSLDGIDVCAATFESQPTLLASERCDLPASIHDEVLGIVNDPNSFSLEKFGALDARLGELFAAAILALIRSQGISRGDIHAIGSHGQTVWHQPNGPLPFSLQIGDPARIAQRTGITTIADFRRADLAVGGQGAPLVPAFHAAIFQNSDEYRTIVNVGGMANITILPPTQCTHPIIGFDTGPGNVLLDLHTSREGLGPYDINGSWGASGTIDKKLLDEMLRDPYFALPPPKSTGREYFNGKWLDRYLTQYTGTPESKDIQATLTELTAHSIIAAICKHTSKCRRILICGGGAYNLFLLRRMQLLVPHITIETTDKYGLSPDWVEAMSFAWLARETLQGKTGNLPSVTGARSKVILGAIYPVTT